MLNIGTKNIDTIYFIVSRLVTKFSRNFSMKKGKSKNLSYENSYEYLNNNESRSKS